MTEDEEREPWIISPEETMNHPHYCECAACQNKRELLAKLNGTGKVHYGPTLPPVKSNQTAITITPEALNNLKETAFEEGRAAGRAQERATIDREHWAMYAAGAISVYGRGVERAAQIAGTMLNEEQHEWGMN